MKRIQFLLAVLMIAVVFSSCEHSSHHRTPAASNTDDKPGKPVFLPRDVKSDTLVVTPEKFGVSEMTTDFQAYPTCDGGECYFVSYTIGVKLLGEDETRVYTVDAHGYSTLKGLAKLKPEIKQALDTYSFAKSCFPTGISVTLVKNKATKIFAKEVWAGKTFTPSRLIWISDQEKDNSRFTGK